LKVALVFLRVLSGDRAESVVTSSQLVEDLNGRGAGLSRLSLVIFELAQLGGSEGSQAHA